LNANKGKEGAYRWGEMGILDGGNRDIRWGDTCGHIERLGGLELGRIRQLACVWEGNAVFGVFREVPVSEQLHCEFPGHVTSRHMRDSTCRLVPIR
jgi:hypothetical protein